MHEIPADITAVTNRYMGLEVHRDANLIRIGTRGSIETMQALHAELDALPSVLRTEHWADDEHALYVTLRTGERWAGARSATSPRTDEDAAMAYQALPGAYPTRKDAREALLSMIREEILIMDSNPYCLDRLAVILGALVANPTIDGFDHDGLSFRIWQTP